MIRYFPLPGDVVSSLVTPPSPAPSTGTSSTFASSQLSQLVPPPAVAGSAALPPSPEPTAAPAVPLTPLTGNAVTQEYASHAIPPALLVRVLDIVDLELGKLEALLQQLEMRFVGASVLVVYEGDPTRLAAALERYDATPPKFHSETGVTADDEDDDGDETSGSDDDDDEDDELDGPKADEKERQKCPPVVLKLIDFAHTWLVDGEGPDQGVLLGLTTLRGLVQGRKRDVLAAMQ